MKVISFSLWGDKPIYLVGAIRNADLAKQFYPDFQCWYYVHRDTVPIDTVEALQQKDNVKIIFKEGDLNKVKPMMWRFESIDHPDVEVNMSRDVDTKFLLREKLAVDQWLESDKDFHVMRDHPHHNYKIQGGMFGVRKGRNGKNIIWNELLDRFLQDGDRMYDQDFLRDTIYPLYQNSMIIHASFNRFESECLYFPISYESDDYRFVGEYVYADESRNQDNIRQIKTGRGHCSSIPAQSAPRGKNKNKEDKEDK